MLSQVQLLLVASFSSMLLMEVSSAPRKHMPSELLPADPLKDKDLAILILLRIISEVMAAEREMLLLPQEGEEEAGVREGEVMMRRQVPFSQRDRKAGCRNFFWKTFTSC
ncbi:somatostatin-1A [Takifugu rubripes]|uniref:somatostatin-1A n=1 Tax=Takifugu rubripes TaxID=31033 RepID=UPI001145E9A4|nr:somatostatin-1A-like [Takifugu rubripes]